MQISSVTLNNFRSFFGEKSIEFATDRDRPITIVIGENGGGKTNLLNAIFWAFTDGFTPRFENPQRLINSDAVSAGVKECFVEIAFEHGSKRYIVRRTANIGGRSWAQLWPVAVNGTLEAVLTEDRAKNYLESILPKHLANWFIFDGEAVGKINLTGSRSLKDSLYQTFGFTKLSEVCANLNSLVTEYSREIGSHVKDEKLSKLNDEIETEERRLENYSDELKDIEREIEEKTRAEENYSRELSSLDKSSQLERRRSVAQGAMKENKNLLINEEAKRNVLLRKSAPCVVLRESLAEILIEFKKVAESQDIPAPHNEILVSRILEEKLCICERPVLPGTKEESTIKALLVTASTQAMTFRVQELNASAHSFQNIAASYFEHSAEINKRISLYENVIYEQDRILKEIEKELDGIDEKEVAKLRDVRRSVMERISALHERKGNILLLQRQSKEAFQRAVNQRDILVNQLGKNDVLTKEKNKVERLRDYVEKRFEQQEKEVLSKLSVELSAAVDQFLVKNYQLEIKPETYEIITRDLEGREKTLTTGEKQTVTFAFVAAIVGMASSNTRFSNVDWIAEPISAPLVLDAPFSVQDELYRSKTAKNIADHSHQCVLMFDADKWRGELAEAVGERVGRFYALITCARGPQKDALKFLTLNHKKIPLNKYESDRDESEVLEVFLNA